MIKITMYREPYFITYVLRGIPRLGEEGKALKAAGWSWASGRPGAWVIHNQNTAEQTAKRLNAQIEDITQEIKSMEYRRAV